MHGAQVGRISPATQDEHVKACAAALSLTLGAAQPLPCLSSEAGGASRLVSGVDGKQDRQRRPFSSAHPGYELRSGSSMLD